MKRTPLPSSADRSPDERALFRIRNAIEEPLAQLDRAIIAMDDVALNALEAGNKIDPSGLLFIAEAMRGHFDAVKAALRDRAKARRKKAPPPLAVVRPPDPAA